MKVEAAMNREDSFWLWSWYSGMFVVVKPPFELKHLTTDRDGRLYELLLCINSVDVLVTYETPRC